jgi:hypothetical protein
MRDGVISAVETSRGFATRILKGAGLLPSNENYSEVPEDAPIGQPIDYVVIRFKA